ncbi:hypothetical protein CEXT_515631 [Caerostris extrusa]|uniref:Uncharacterized protein n=1 Tax=Caerostris extrusa TaxID=172846 RepID=A0AAV4NY78_CAEEX|nr:hypothetical protein CEXT_515631 [Caerostris extrusa]
MIDFGSVDALHGFPLYPGVRHIKETSGFCWLVGNLFNVILRSCDICLRLPANCFQENGVTTLPLRCLTLGKQATPSLSLPSPVSRKWGPLSPKWSRIE